MTMESKGRRHGFQGRAPMSKDADYLKGYEQGKAMRQHYNASRV